MGQRSAEQVRASLIDEACELFGREDETTTRSPQSLVSGTGDDIGVWDRIEATCQHFSGHEPGEMSHIDEQPSTTAVGDFLESFEIDQSRVSRVARQKN